MDEAATEMSRQSSGIAGVLLVLLMVGCASAPPNSAGGDSTTVQGAAGETAEPDAASAPAFAVVDPAQKLNQRSFALSEALDRRLLRPVALGYHRVVPGPLRAGVRNFFSNLRGVDSALNGFLQGKPRRGFTDAGRVLVNSTVGLGGLFDPATDLGLEYQGEDFGQTLAVWGYTESAYVYLPVVGPLTVRDLPTLVLRFAWPRLILGEHYNVGTGSLDVVALREQALVATDARDAAALSPYVFTREAYYQRRRFQIFDGKPPTETLLQQFDEFEEFDD